MELLGDDISPFVGDLVACKSKNLDVGDPISHGQKPRIPNIVAS